MAPTLEEFERILNSPKVKKGTYKILGKFLEIEDLAEVLGIPFSDL